MIRVKAPPMEHSRRASIRLVVVLHVGGRTDRAGPSSEGPRLDLLQTMEFIKGQMADATIVDPLQDSSSGIPIGEWISAQKAQKKAKEGTTELTIKEVLELAVKELESDKNHVGFILLLSDARNEFDCKSSDTLYKNLKDKFPVHAFGLGNEKPEVLRRIAEISKGTYSCVKAETRDLLASEITKAIALCLGGLQSVVAVGVHVDIKVEIRKESILLENFIIKIEPSGSTVTSNHGTSASISVGVLYAGEVKDFIVHLDFSQGNSISNPERNRIAYLTAQVYKVDSSRREQAGADGKYELPLLVTKTSDTSICWEAYTKLKGSLLPCRLVLQQMIRFDVLEMLDSFAKDCRDQEKTQKQGNKQLGAALQSKWNELKKKGGRFEMAQKMDLDVGAIRNAVDAMVRCLNDGGPGGLRSIYSWVSSYRMQRVATTGLVPAATTEFLTPDMKDAMEKARKEALAKHAMGLFDRVEKLLDWSKRCPTTEASSSSGGSDESRKHVDDFVSSIIYEATSGEPPHSTPPPAVEEGDTKYKYAVGLLDKIDELLNLSKMCLTTKASSSVRADNESRKRVDDLIRRLIYEVAVAAMDEWWATSGKAPHSTPAAPPPQVEHTKSNYAIGLLHEIDRLLNWSKVFPATTVSPSSGGADGHLDLIRRLICEAAVVAVNEWRRVERPAAPSPPPKETLFAVGMFDYIETEVTYLLESQPMQMIHNVVQNSIYNAAVEGIQEYRKWLGITSASHAHNP